MADSKRSGSNASAEARWIGAPKRNRGSHLRIGNCLLEIRGETRPCERMEEAAHGLKSALSSDWRGGVFAGVLRGGVI
jgi:MOSC domain-containing protein YiiM